MSQRRLRGSLWACFLFVFGTVGGCRFRDATLDEPLRGRDLILITVDTLRADAVGAYSSRSGSSPTPVIDALAERGLVFTQATAPMPRTTPSLASLLSGRSPKHHGSREVGQAMVGDVPLIADVLRRPDVFTSESASPYLTVAVTGNRAAAAPQGLDRGFDIFRVVPGDKPAAAEVTDMVLAALEEVLVSSPEASSGERSSSESSRPLFLWVHYVDPHFPYDPPGAEDDECIEAIRIYEEHAAFVFLDHDGVSSRALGDCARRYRQEASRADGEIGRLVDGLARLGRPVEESLVVFTSDHGENLGEDDLFFEHGPSLHDAGLRVPLIVAGAGVEPRRDDGVTELQDVAPTVLTLLGVRPDATPPMDGRDLSQRWLGQGSGRTTGDADDHVAFAESNSSLHVRVWNAVVAGRIERHCVHRDRWSLCGSGDALEAFQLFDHEADPLLEVDLTDRYPDVTEALRRQRQTWPPETARSRAVRGPRFKLVETPIPEGGYERRLYDLEADPAESRDVSADFPAVAERMGVQLDRFLSELPTPGQVVRDDEDLEALRALGYVQ